MRVELKIYTTKKQRLQMRKLHAAAIRVEAMLAGRILPGIELLAGIALILLMCCMDSENFQLVFASYCLTGGLLLGSHVLKLMLDGRLSSERARLRRACMPYSQPALRRAF